MKISSPKAINWTLKQYGYSFMQLLLLRKLGKQGSFMITAFLFSTFYPKKFRGLLKAGV
jgi:hypothetical protein